MARVFLDSIVRQLNTTPILKNITFEVPDGQFWVLVGPSGCGKSTILRTIAGLEAATSGDLYIGEQCVNRVPARQRDVAMVFQNYALYPHMTVAENLAFGLQMRRVDVAAIQDRVQTTAAALNIEHLLDRKPRQLSGGQQQRVALGRAIVRQPQVFLLDEPLSNLDAQLRDDTRAELKQLHQRLGITTLYVTHDQVEAMTLADRLVVLDRGEIQRMGDPQQVYAQPVNRMVATFLGSPPMNLLPVIYQDGQFQIGSQTIPCPDRLLPYVQPGQSYELGIRPEQLHPASLEAASLKVKVAMIEPLGRETLIRAVLVDRSVCFYAAADRRPQLGENLWLEFDPTQLLMFDAATGKNVELC